MAAVMADAGRDRPAALVSPSILSADFSCLAEECQRIVALGADWLHIDVMDGHFVPNLTIGAPVVASLRKHLATAFMDCHLMVSRPEQWIQPFAAAGADMYTFHLEAVADPDQLSSSEPHAEVARVAAAVRAAGMKAGLALRPSTPAELALPYVRQGLVDMVLVLTVEPGFGGQPFMAHVVDKCRVLRAAAPGLHIQVDGGIGPATAAAAAAAGANVMVAGSAVFGAQDPGAVIALLRREVDAAAAAAAPAASASHVHDARA